MSEFIDMKIMSLNICRFKNDMENRRDRTICDEKIENVRKYILEFLKDEPNLVVLQEVPFYCGEVLEETYSAWISSFEENGFKVFVPTQYSESKNPISCTIAISKESGGWEYNDYTIKLNTAKDYGNKFIEIKNNNLSVLGVHMPYDNYAWDMVIDYFSAFETTRDNIIIIGDMNVYDIGTSCKRKFYELLSKGVVDAWVEKANSNYRSTCNSGKRIDYALMSEYLYYKLVDMKIDDTLRNHKIIDHSAIIVEFNETMIR